MTEVTLAAALADFLCTLRNPRALAWNGIYAALNRSERINLSSKQHHIS